MVFTNFNSQMSLQDFENWIQEHPINDPVVESLRYNLKFLELPLEKQPKGVNSHKIRSARLIKTVKAIAKEILCEFPDKMKKVEKLQFYFNSDTYLSRDNVGNIDITISPHDIFEGITDLFWLNKLEKIKAKSKTDHLLYALYEAFLNEYLFYDPTILIFWVGHEITHYKYNDEGIRLTNCKIAFAYLKKKHEGMDKHALIDFEKQLRTTANKQSRKFELRADHEAYESLGGAQIALAHFSKSRSNEPNNFDKHKNSSTHPSDTKRIELAKKYVNTPNKVLDIHLSILDRIQEIVKSDPVIGLM